MFYGEIHTGKVDLAEFEQLKRFFMRLELIAHSPEEFDAHEHFNEKDPDFEFMTSFMKDGLFNYKDFVHESIKEIGTGFARVINGYELLVERYCDPESLILEPKRSKEDKKLE